jgi:DNA-binding response OmpR family regulator
VPKASLQKFAEICNDVLGYSGRAFERFRRRIRFLRHSLQFQGERPILRVSDSSVDIVRRIVNVGKKDVNLSEAARLSRVLVQPASKMVRREFLQRKFWSASTAPYPERMSDNSGRRLQ